MLDAEAAHQCQHQVDRRRRLTGQAAQFLNRRHQRIDLHRPSAFEILKHRGLVRADISRALDAAVDVDRKADAEFFPIACASSIIARATDRVPSSATMSSSVLPVSAEIGLNDRLPQSFTHISLRISSRTGACSPAATSSCASAQDAVALFAGRLAKREALAFDMADQARRIDLGRRIDHRSRSHDRGRVSSRSGRRDRPTARRVPSSAPPILWKYHQGTPFCMVTTAVLFAEQRRNLIKGGANRMGFQRKHDIVLNAEVLRVCRGPYRVGGFLPSPRSGAVRRS